MEAGNGNANIFDPGTVGETEFYAEQPMATDFFDERPLSAPLAQDTLLQFSGVDGLNLPEDLRTHDMYDEFYRMESQHFPDLPPPLARVSQFFVDEGDTGPELPTFTGFKAEPVRMARPVFGEAPRRSSRPSRPTSDLTLANVVGQVSVVATDQVGCRTLQSRLQEYQDTRGASCSDFFEVVLSEAAESLHSLMVDPFGNYLCQKLFDVCTSAQRLGLLRTISIDLHVIALNMHGTRSVQKLIEAATTDAERDLIIGGLRRDFVELIKDLNGNHVIQKCLSCFSPQKNQFIFDAAASACLDIAVHQHGCCVYQRCIDSAAPAQRAALVAEVVRHCVPLIQNSYGNYVVQYTMELDGGRDHHADDIVEMVTAYGIQLATQKFSSNVIEKCLELATPHMRSVLIDAMIVDPGFPQLLRDPFGNYVVQKCMDFSTRAQLDTIADIVARNMPVLRSSPFAKRIIDRCQGFDSPHAHRGAANGHQGPRSPARTPGRGPPGRGRGTPGRGRGRGRRH